MAPASTARTEYFECFSSDPYQCRWGWEQGPNRVQQVVTTSDYHHRVSDWAWLSCWCCQSRLSRSLRSAHRKYLLLAGSVSNWANNSACETVHVRKCEVEDHLSNRYLFESQSVIGHTPTVSKGWQYSMLTLNENLNASKHLEWE